MKLVSDEMLSGFFREVVDDLNQLLIRQEVTRFIRACEEQEKKMLPPGRIDATDHLPKGDTVEGLKTRFDYLLGSNPDSTG